MRKPGWHSCRPAGRHRRRSLHSPPKSVAVRASKSAAPYPETEACSGTGMGFCAFRFRNAQGLILAITTTGEELPDLTVFDWRNE